MLCRVSSGRKSASARARVTGALQNRTTAGNLGRLKTVCRNVIRTIHFQGSFFRVRPKAPVLPLRSGKQCGIANTKACRRLRGQCVSFDKMPRPTEIRQKSEDRFLERDWIPCTDERSRRLFCAEAENTLFRDIEKGIETHAVLRAGRSPTGVRKACGRREMPPADGTAAFQSNQNLQASPAAQQCAAGFLFFQTDLLFQKPCRREGTAPPAKILPAGMRAKAVGAAFYASAGVSARYASKMPAASAARRGQGRLR